MQTGAFTRFFTLMTLTGALAFAQGSSQQNNPAGKFYVADVEGFAQINTGEKIEDIKAKAVFDAAGTEVETKLDSTVSLVMSNGVGLNFAPETKLVVKRFEQGPFQPNREDLETEPSISHTRATLVRGAIAISTGKLVAGSSMVFDTPHGSLNILSQTAQKAAVQVNDETTTVTVFAGAVTLRLDNKGNGETLLPGQQATIKRQGTGQLSSITVQPTPKDLPPALEDMVETAFQALKTVYFDVAERQVNTTADGTTDTTTTATVTELVPVIINPVDPQDVGSVVSPARP